MIYAGSLDGHLRAFEATTGRLLWDFSGGRSIETPVVANQVAYAVSSDGRLRALGTRTGELLWEFRAGALTPQIVATDDVVYVSSHDQHLRAFDARTGKLLADLSLRDGLGSLVTADGVIYASGSDAMRQISRVVALDMAKIRAEPPPEAIWHSDAQFWAYVIWGKGGLAARKIADGLPLSQILKYDNWKSPDELAAEIERLAKLSEQPDGIGDWDGPLALSLDPATLCPPELKSLLRADLTKQGIPCSAQLYLGAAETSADKGEALEYAREALRLAPQWRDAQQRYRKLSPMN